MNDFLEGYGPHLVKHIKPPRETINPQIQFDSRNLFNFKLTTQTDFSSNSIKLTMDRMGEIVSREIINLKDKAVREALIKMGWKPPEESEEYDDLNKNEGRGWPKR